MLEAGSFYRRVCRSPSIIHSQSCTASFLSIASVLCAETPAETPKDLESYDNEQPGSGAVGLGGERLGPLRSLSYGTKHERRAAVGRMEKPCDGDGDTLRLPGVFRFHVGVGAGYIGGYQLPHRP